MGPSDPLVSVVMAVYDERPYVKKAVQSILDQTFEDFEFIIINDGSTDGSKKILERLADRDDRIRLIHQENKGLIASLNRGLRMARGRYIARMDADDVSYDERLEEQVRFLNRNSNIGILGAQVDLIDESSELVGEWRFPTDPDQIGWSLLFGNCFCHPTVMMRSSLARDLNGYSKWAKDAEDYELWSRAFLKSKLANFSGTLLKYRPSVIEGRKERKSQYRTECEIVSRLHRNAFREEADEEAAEFIMTLKEYGIIEAKKRTNIKNKTRAVKYSEKIYKKYAENFRSSIFCIYARRDLISIQDRIYNYGENKRVKKEINKMKSRATKPYWEILPWIYYYLKRKINKVRDERLEINSPLKN